MTGASSRSDVARILRQLNHDFIDHEISDADLDSIATRLDAIHALISAGARRVRTISAEQLDRLEDYVPNVDEISAHQVMSDSVVSGGCNPMGLGATLFRDGDEAVMRVTLGRAFEGAPGRAHGGMVAALIDETMGLAVAMDHGLAFTAQLDITYVAPTPILEVLEARATVVRHDGRKRHVDATVSAGSTVVARASALFIEVDLTALRNLAATNEA